MHELTCDVCKGLHSEERIVAISDRHRGLDLPIRIRAESDLTIHVDGDNALFPRQFRGEPRHT